MLLGRAGTWPKLEKTERRVAMFIVLTVVAVVVARCTLNNRKVFADFGRSSKIEQRAR